MKGIIENAKLITCILPKGKATQIQRPLIDEHGLHAANFYRGRGVGRISQIKARGIGEQLEKEVLEICVKAEEADDLFEHIFFAGEMDQPHGGVLFMTTLQQGMEITMPDLPEES